MQKDFYKILGVNKTDTQEQIKKAYRKLAMKYHPDRNKGNKQAEEKFKEINEAYEVLGDEKKKQQYDTFGTSGFSGAGTHGFSQQDFGGFEDIFSQFGGSGKKQKSQGFGFDFSDLFGGGYSENFTQQKQSQSAKQSTEPSLDIEKTYEVPIFDLILGCSIEVEGERRKRVKLKIPASTKPGTKFRIKELGKISGAKVGNMIVKIDGKMPKHISELDKSLLERIREGVGY